MEILGVIGFVAFIVFLVMLIKAAVKKQPKKRLGLITVACFVLFIVGMGNSEGASSAGSGSTQKSAPVAAISTAPSATPSATEKTDITNSVSKDTVVAALKKKDETLAEQITDVTLSESTVTVAIYFENLWDENSFVTNNQHYSAEVFQQVFQNPNIQTVIYQADVPVNDQYGNTSKKTAQTNTMARADADKVADWEKFAWETPAQYYSVVKFQLANESEISGLHKAWFDYYGE